MSDCKFSGGWAFLDILIGLFLLGLVLISVFGNIAWTAMLTRQNEDRMYSVIEYRNNQAAEQNAEFTEEIFKE